MAVIVITGAVSQWKKHTESIKTDRPDYEFKFITDTNFPVGYLICGQNKIDLGTFNDKLGLSRAISKAINKCTNGTI